MMTEKWYKENLPQYKAGYEDNLIVQPRYTDHIIDISHFKMIDGVPKLPKAKTKATDKKKPKRHGDAGIAYALAYAASKMPIPMYDYEATKRPSKHPPHFATTLVRGPETLSIAEILIFIILSCLWHHPCHVI